MTTLDLSTLDLAAMPEDLKRNVLEQEVHRRAEQARDSLDMHTRLVHRAPTGARIVPARHHQEWIRLLEDREKHPFLCVIAPPGSAKSFYFSIAYPAWRLGQQPDLRIGLISRVHSHATGFSRAVQEALDTPEFQTAYPGVEPDYLRGWALNQWFLKTAPPGPNPSFLASGIGGRGVLGRRFDEIIVDDPTAWDDARSEDVMEKQRNWLRAVLLTRFPPNMRPPHGYGGRMVVVLTRWSERDLVPTLKDLGFTIVNMPSLGYWDQTVNEDGEVEYGDAPLWPEVEGREQLDAERADDELMFELVKQGNPRVLGGHVFDSQHFQRGTPPPRSEFERVVQYADTAGGKDRKKGDYFALATVGIKGQDVWILDMVRERIPAPEQEDAVRIAAARWDPELICIEAANEGTALYQRLSLHSRLPLDDVTPTKDKEFRAIPLSNAYRARRVWHPEGERWVPRYETELAQFPQGAHDDQVDAAGGAYAKTEDPGPRIRILG